LYDELGRLNWENSTWNNPLAGQLKTQGLMTKNLMVNSVLNYEVLNGLDVKVSLGYADMTTDELLNEPNDSYSPSIRPSVQHRSQHKNVKRNSWIVEPQMLYATRLGKGKLDALVGGTFQRSDNNILTMAGIGYSDKSLIGYLRAADIVSV